VPDVPELDTRPLDAAGPGGWQLAGRYRMLERVGTGGMAEVFRAHDELLDRDVAVKVFRTMVSDPDSANAESRRELELQAMARLNHPNLVTLFDGAVRGEGPPYLVLEYVAGPNLAARLREGPLPEPAVRALGEHVAEGLAYVHAQGLVHRDVKPANILLSETDGRARLSDFGVVRMIGRPQMTSTELTIGTAYYLAPEQARGSAVGPEADVYALGLVLLEALTGRRSFDGPMHEALAARLATDPAIPDGLPEPWPGLLAAMTARDPAARPSAAAVAVALRGGDALAAVPPLASSLLPLSAPESEPIAAADPPRRHRGLLLAGVAAASVAVIAFGASYLIPSSSQTPAGTTPTTVTTSSSGPKPVTTVRHHSGVPAAAVVPVNSGKSTSKHPVHKHHRPAATKTSGGSAGAPRTTAPAAPTSSPAAVTSSALATNPPTSGAPATDPAPGGTAGAQADPATTTPAGP